MTTNTPDVKTAQHTAAQPQAIDWMWVGDQSGGNQTRVDLMSDGSKRYADGRPYEEPKPKL
jgi:hypothetical protein